MKINMRLAAAAGTLAIVGGFVVAAAPVNAAAPAPVDVSNSSVTCDTLTGSLKFTSGLVLQGTPGVTSNPITASIGLDGCTSATPGVSLKGQKFKTTLTGTGWVAGTHCNLDGTAATPLLSGSHPCFGQWLAGGKFDGLNHPQDDNGSFGSNSCTGLSGASATAGSTAIVWKTTPGAAKLFDSGHLAGHAETDATIANAFGATGNDLFGTNRAIFYVGSPNNSVPGVSGLTQETATGAFTGGNSGHTSEFHGMLANSVASVFSYCFSTGIKALTFASGGLVSA